MKLVPEMFTSVAVGAWNPGIFAPQWLAAHVVPGADVDVEVAFGPGQMVTRLLCDGLIVIPSRTQLVVGVQVDTSKWSNTAAALAKIIGTLSHTPLAGVGINFGFVEPTPPERLAGLFILSDRAALIKAGATIGTVRIQQRLTLRDDLVVNLNFTQSDDHSVQIQANVHFDARDAGAASEWLNRRRQEDLLQLTTDLLNNAYGMVLEQENLDDGHVGRVIDRAK